MASIQGVYAREILDSRGWPTLECTVWLDTGVSVSTSVPSGTSVGKYEAKELRDNDQSRMLGKGVRAAANLINTTISPQLVGRDPLDQHGIDQLLLELDGTKDKQKLGANTTLAVSQAVCRAGAAVQNQALYHYIQSRYQLTDYFSIPTCIYTVVNGGDQGADNLDIQEFEIIPASHIDYLNSLNMATELFYTLKNVLEIKGAIHAVGLVGGYTPNLYSNSDVFEILVETIKASKYTFAQDLFFGIDTEASALFEGGKYRLKDKAHGYTAGELALYYKKLRSLYHVFYIEDPFREEDIDDWQSLVKEMGDTTRVVADTLTATNPERLAQVIDRQLCNSVLVKPNQVGTISETIAFVQLAKQHNIQTIVSHRSGETCDDFIADLAVGVGVDYVKFGPPNRGERVAKYNRLSQIYTELQYNANNNTVEQQ